MTTRSVIFDIDGTLVDSNAAHVEAWRQAFAARGYDIAPERIAREVGKGGDNLVPAIIGERGDAADGDVLRQDEGERFKSMTEATRFVLFPGTLELLDALRARGVLTAIATSSKIDQIDALMTSVGVDLRERVDEVVTGDDAERTKPAPDLVQVAVSKLGAAASECVMIGDTPYDGEAARKVGVAFVGVTCGGCGNDEPVLRGASARSVWRDPADILAHLDTALTLDARTR